jgi:hypothetical protein
MIQTIGDDVLLCTSDKRLARAAQSEGIGVVDPEIETVASFLELLGVAGETSEESS